MVDRGNALTQVALSKWPAEYVAACGEDESGQVSPSLGGETWEGVGVPGVEGSW